MNLITTLKIQGEGREIERIKSTGYLIRVLSALLFYELVINDTATTEIYTLLIGGSVRCV